MSEDRQTQIYQLACNAVRVLIDHGIITFAGRSQPERVVMYFHWCGVRIPLFTWQQNLDT